MRHCPKKNNYFTNERKSCTPFFDDGLSIAKRDPLIIALTLDMYLVSITSIRWVNRHELLSISIHPMICEIWSFQDNIRLLLSPSNGDFTFFQHIILL